jgi:hypothetical protein
MSQFPDQRDVMFYAAIGRLAVAWAHLETGLDMMIEIVHRGLGGANMDPERPRALQRKLRYLRKFMRATAMTDPEREPYDRLFREIEQQSEFRHDIIHGMVVEFATSEGEAQLMRFLHEKGDLSKKAINVTTTSIMEAAVQAEKLGLQTLRWTDEFIDALPDILRSIEAQTR